MIKGATAQELIVVHLDVNGTIMVADKAQGKTTEDYVNIEFAKQVRGLWQPNQPEMSFREFVEKHVIQGNGVQRAIKDVRNEMYKAFVTSEYLHHHPESNSLSRQHRQYMIHANAMDSLLFPSFWRLVDWAKDKPFVRFVFRTFGYDIPDIKEILENRGYMLSNILAYDSHGVLMDQGQKVESERMWRDLFNAVHDNYKRWHENGETELFAKPFMQPELGTAIFFDDNARLKRIIAPVVGQRDALIESGHIVAVRTLSALTDPEYFVSHVERLIADQH